MVRMGGIIDLAQFGQERPEADDLGAGVSFTAGSEPQGFEAFDPGAQDGEEAFGLDLGGEGTAHIYVADATCGRSPDTLDPAGAAAP